MSRLVLLKSHQMILLLSQLQTLQAIPVLKNLPRPISTLNYQVLVIIDRIHVRCLLQVHSQVQLEWGYCTKIWTLATQVNVSIDNTAGERHLLRQSILHEDADFVDVIAKVISCYFKL
jgi:hypothetical protein